MFGRGVFGRDECRGVDVGGAGERRGGLAEPNDDCGTLVAAAGVDERGLQGDVGVGVESERGEGTVTNVMCVDGAKSGGGWKGN